MKPHAREPDAFDLKKHLEEEHKTNPFSTYLREIVYGGNDGIVTTFAVVAGFAGAQAHTLNLPIYSVLLFGLANLFADGLSMGLGNFLSTRSEQDLYETQQKKERYEIRNNREMETVESIHILQSKGFDREQAEKLVAIYSTNERYWLEFMMKEELEMSDPTDDNPSLMALATFTSFTVFGSIPLLPYLFFGANATFMHSVIATATALVLLGILRWKVTNLALIRSVIEVLLLGGTAATAAYLVGTFFRI